MYKRQARLYSSEGGASGFSVYRDRSFIRFQNVALAYSVPQRLAEKLRAQGIKLFGSVQNVGYYAPHWDFWDAEANEPLPRIMTLGLDLTF